MQKEGQSSPHCCLSTSVCKLKHMQICIPDTHIVHTFYIYIHKHIYMHVCNILCVLYIYYIYMHITHYKHYIHITYAYMCIYIHFSAYDWNAEKGAKSMSVSRLLMASTKLTCYKKIIREDISFAEFIYITQYFTYPEDFWKLCQKTRNMDHKTIVN